MMSLTKRHAWLVWALLLCLVVANGIMAAPSVVHVAHHANHQAKTHATSLCAWLCAAGQAVESGMAYPDAHNRTIVPFELRPVETITAVPSSPTWFRGPPHVLV